MRGNGQNKDSAPFFVSGLILESVRPQFPLSMSIHIGQLFKEEFERQGRSKVWNAINDIDILESQGSKTGY